MKILLVLFALVAAVYCDSAAIGEAVYDTKSCLEFSYITSGNGGVKDIRTKYEICCKERFDPKVKVPEFDKKLKLADIPKIVKKHYPRLTKGKTDCYHTADK